MTAAKFKHVSVKEIQVERSQRQRKSLGDVGILADSIKRLGVINPITVTKELFLIAGERRLQACKMLDEDYKIPVRFYEELDSGQRQIIELEENLKREELSWIDKVISINHIHELYKSLDNSQTYIKTGESIGLDPSVISRSCMVAERIAEGDQRIIEAPGLSQALNIIERRVSRAVDNELNNLLEVERDDVHFTEKSGQTEEGKDPVGSSASRPREQSVYNTDFTEWVKEYSGRRFNLIHCDFPYGINHQDSEQGGTATGRHLSYLDDEETYWRLCGELTFNLNKLMTASGHLIFWFSMKFYRETIQFFERNSDLHLVDERPLIWYKSDGKGIASDVERRPRNVYETALLFSRGDRKIITPVDNVYACPTSKNRVHPSEKPEPMLRHFFRLFVDSFTELLDPTCGAGSALRAADYLGSKRVYGLEINKEFADEASGSLTRSRSMARLSESATLLMEKDDE